MGAPSPDRDRQRCRSAQASQPLCSRLRGIHSPLMGSDSDTQLPALSALSQYMQTHPPSISPTPPPHTPFFPPLGPKLASGMATSIKKDRVSRWVAKLQADDGLFSSPSNSHWRHCSRKGEQSTGSLSQWQAGLKGNAKIKKHCELGPALSLRGESHP